MSRAPIALLAGLAGFIAYVAAAVWLADQLAPMHWLAQAVYFLAAGLLWVLPARWLIVWVYRRP